jgi:hypothetical protein
MRRVGKANGSRERASDGVPTTFNSGVDEVVGTARRAPLPTLQAYSAGLLNAAARTGADFHESAHARK